MGVRGMKRDLTDMPLHTNLKQTSQGIGLPPLNMLYFIRILAGNSLLTVLQAESYHTEMPCDV